VTAQTTRLSCEDTDWNRESLHRHVESCLFGSEAMILPALIAESHVNHSVHSGQPWIFTINVCWQPQ
jgi:hypothetical protein